MHQTSCDYLLISLLIVISIIISNNLTQVFASPSRPCWRGDVHSNSCVEFLIRSRGWSRETTLYNIKKVQGFQTKGIIPLEVFSETTARFAVINVAVACMQRANLLPLGDECTSCGTLCVTILKSYKELCALYCPDPPPPRPLRAPHRTTLGLRVSTASVAMDTLTAILRDDIEIKETTFNFKSIQRIKEASNSTESSRDGNIASKSFVFVTFMVVIAVIISLVTLTCAKLIRDWFRGRHRSSLTDNPSSQRSITRPEQINLLKI